jgi:hypothetical protein
MIAHLPQFSVSHPDRAAFCMPCNVANPIVPCGFIREHDYGSGQWVGLIILRVDLDFTWLFVGLMPEHPTEVEGFT